MKWKSNALRNQKENDGTIFYLKEINLKLSIHKYLGCGNNLYLTCSELGFSRESLKTECFDEAVEIAKNKINQRLEYLQNEYKKFIDDKSENEFSRY